MSIYFCSNAVPAKQHCELQEPLLMVENEAAS